MPPVTRAMWCFSVAMLSPPCGPTRLTFDGECYAHAPADAQRGEPALRVAALHLVQQRDQHARARCADRVADGDSATIHVDAARVPAHLLVHGARLGREG